MSETRERIPPHLRQYVATQDYAAYDELDQAVWRFVLLQTHARLIASAHPAYAEGLAATGLGVERIPRIEAMDARLARFGWGAVCVDGFIPPRAFQEFQAHRILPIAGAIRTQEHLAYTPAPDIIHEAAGHAPILPDAEYRAVLQRFGEIGARAFSKPHDRRSHAQIHALSELKEDPGANRAAVAAVEGALAEEIAAAGAPSEAALLSRLHWWTVEYGLVGTPRDYRLYGAGLLSSLGESLSCHAARVAKLPLTAACIDVAYDITRPQPQLFVARDFAQVGEVLERVADSLSQRCGGEAALAAALASEEVATLELACALQASGTLRAVHGSLAAPACFALSGPAALALAGEQLAGFGPDVFAEGFALATGRVEGDAVPLGRGESQPDRLGAARAGEAITLRLASGLRASGTFAGPVPAQGEGALGFRIRQAAASLGETAFDVPGGELIVVPFPSPLATAFAGPADARFWTASEPSAVRVPLRRARPAADQPLVALYREALRLWEEPSSPALIPGFQRIADALRRDHPDDWLLRWNLLESLHKLDAGVVLACALRDDLLDVEARTPGDAATRAPISLGLRYLGFEPRGGSA